MKDKKSASLFQKEQVMESLKQSFVKLDPRVMIKNPIMFTVELVTLVMLVVCILSLGTTEWNIRVQLSGVRRSLCYSVVR